MRPDVIDELVLGLGLNIDGSCMLSGNFELKDGNFEGSFYLFPSLLKTMALSRPPVAFELTAVD